MHRFSFSRGSIIYRQGQFVGSVFIVKKGMVKLYFSDESGREIAFDLIGENEIFGSFDKSDEFAEAFENIEFLAISRNEINKLDRKTLSWILEKMMQRYQVSKSRIKNFALMPLENRIVQTAFWLVEKIGRIDNGKIVLNLSQEEFASFCGATRECVSKALNQMKNSGFVDTSRKKIVLYITEKFHISELK